MAESYAFSLIGVMDCLWFHQTIFFTESPSVPCPKHLESVQYPQIENRENDSSVPVEITPQDDHEDKEEAGQDETTKKERPMRLDFVACKSRSYSCSPGVDIRQKKLQWTKSCGELEIQEVKGFMDLGFKFDKEHASKKTMSVLPGLQRLQLIKTKPGRVVLSRNSDRTYKDIELEKDDGDMEFTERDIVRPYLSEAWLIKTPDSPLLNLRMPRVSASADMKNHIRHWAKTVATVIRQES